MLFYIIVLAIIFVLLFLVNSWDLFKKKTTTKLKKKSGNQDAEASVEASMDEEVVTSEDNTKPEDLITTDTIAEALQKLQDKFFTDPNLKCGENETCASDENKTAYTTCIDENGEISGETVDGDVTCPHGFTKSLTVCCQKNTCKVKPPCPEGYEQRDNSFGDACCYPKSFWNSNLYGLGIKTDIDVQQAEGIAKDVGLALVISPGTPKLVIKAAQRMLPKTTKRIVEIASKVSAKSVNRIAKGLLKPRYVTKILKVAQSLGIDIAYKAGKKASQQVGKSLAGFGAKAATKYGTVFAAGSTAGPVGIAGATVASAAMAVLDGVSLILDLFDVGGYGEIEFKSSFLRQKDILDKELREDLKNDGYPEPYEQIMGPLDLLSDDQLAGLIADKYNAIFSSQYFSTIMKNVTDRSDGKTEDEILALFDEEFEKVSDAIQKQSYSEICDSAGGFIVDDKCSYKRTECNGYEWPAQLDENTDISSFQFRRFVNDKCVAESPDIRSACEESGIPYDFQDGICAIDEKYCLEKGANWKDGDCHIDDAQKAFEFLIGETAVRGLKQVFDPKQYESCGENEKDDGYMCRKQECNEGDELNGELCYPKPRDGFYGNGPVAWASCPSGRDGGVFCTRGSYGRGVGTIPELNNCPEGSHDIGGTCWSNDDGHCDGGCRTSCPSWKLWECHTECEPIVCHPSYVTKNIGDRGTSCPYWKEEQNGLCYDRCNEGYNGEGPVCWENCPPNTSGTTCTKDSYGRGAGYIPKTAVRVKNRKAEYSKGKSYGVAALIPKS